jgi:hypothetical protein
MSTAAKRIQRMMEAISSQPLAKVVSSLLRLEEWYNEAIAVGNYSRMWPSSRASRLSRCECLPAGPLRDDASAARTNELRLLFKNMFQNTIGKHLSTIVGSCILLKEARWQWR